MRAGLPGRGAAGALAVWARLGACVLLLGCGAPDAPAAASTGLLESAAGPVADSTFVRLVDRLSEPGGYFDTDNLISNEDSYLHPLGVLREVGVEGGVYLGVGPDQNFAYMAEVRPRMAFLIDVRRDNLLQHLWFKALFTLAETRGDYLALMFGREGASNEAGGEGAGGVRDGPILAEAPGEVADSPRALLAELAALRVAPDTARDIRERVRRTVASFGVPLSEDDLEMVDFIHRSFVVAGPELKFTSFGRGADWRYPSYRDLILSTDLEGRAGHYLADAADYAFLRRMQLENRVVPVVGDLAGPHAVRAIGDEVRAMGEVVSAFYTSNVEFYLFGDGTYGDFARNTLTLPRNSTSVLIRSFFRGAHPLRRPGFLSTQLVQRMDRFAELWESGEIRSYGQLVRSPHEGGG